MSWWDRGIGVRVEALVRTPSRDGQFHFSTTRKQKENRARERAEEEEAKTDETQDLAEDDPADGPREDHPVCRVHPGTQS
jgi:hypothetical protein